MAASQPSIISIHFLSIWLKSRILSSYLLGGAPLCRFFFGESNLKLCSEITFVYSTYYITINTSNNNQHCFTSAAAKLLVVYYYILGICKNVKLKLYIRHKKSVCSAGPFYKLTGLVELPAIVSWD